MVVGRDKMSINSSKVYCKLQQQVQQPQLPPFVLIVAKCIVNLFIRFYTQFPFCINSSKVYCKSQLIYLVPLIFLVLIVAKCIVNPLNTSAIVLSISVLIVAKCIVNNLFMDITSNQDGVLIVAKCIVN